MNTEEKKSTSVYNAVKNVFSSSLIMQILLLHYASQGLCIYAHAILMIFTWNKIVIGVYFAKKVTVRNF